MDEGGRSRRRGSRRSSRRSIAIAAIDDVDGLARALGATLRADVDVLNNTNFETHNLFGLWVAQDLSDPTKYSPFLLQGGLGLPDRDYYLDPSPRMAEIRAKYQAHVATMLELAGDRRRRREGGAHRRARAARSRRRTRRARSQRTSRRATTTGRAPTSTKRAPGLDWDGVPRRRRARASRQDFVVWQPTAPTGIAALGQGRSRSTTWKDYLAFHAIERAAPFLPKAFVDERFAFYGTRAGRHAERCASAGSAASTRPARRSARRSASSTSRSTSRPPRRRAPRRW